MIQLQVLNHILHNRDKGFLINNTLDVSFFSDYPDEFQYISHHLSEYGALPDPTTFLSHFPRFDWVEITESPQYLLNALYEDRNRRKLATVFNGIREKLNNDDVEGAMQLFSNSQGELTAARHLDSVDILRDTSRYDVYLEKGQDYKKHYVTTGWPELDKILGGWDRHEELATIMARPGVGKTFFALKSCLAAAQAGLKAGFYSGEMSENKVGYRLDTLISHISNSQLTRGSVEIQPQYKQYLDSLSTLIPGTIKVLTPTMIQGPAGVNALRAFVEKEQLDILFVDQHSLLEDDRKARNPVERAANISRDLKNLQVMAQIPVIAVSQANRASNQGEGAENKMDTSRVAQSDRIGQDSTVVLALEQREGIMTVHVVKARDSVAGAALSYRCDVDKGLWTFIPDADTASMQQCDDLRARFDLSDEEAPF